MKHRKIFVALSLLVFLAIAGCKTTHKIRTGAAGIDHQKGEPVSSEVVTEGATLYKQWNSVPFETLSAKIRVEYTEAGQSQPEVNAFVRVKKDSAIWISVTASFLNIEGMRILITQDSVIILNRLEKTIESHYIEYLKELTSVPFTFNDLQKLVAGQLVLNGGTTLDITQAGKYLRIVSGSPQITNTSYFKMPEGVLAKQTLNIREPGNYITADLLYDEYPKNDTLYFSTLREVSIPEKEIRIALTFKQVEFNNELSLPFNRPSGYTVK
ncbi:MAG: DUF4292 domain-containing protein [Chitinophagaceae bacterium]|nr:DUF4292 domain-containing protein [Chitinophagaceae bacterium]